jgi:hypothetical protein
MGLVEDVTKPLDPTSTAHIISPFVDATHVLDTMERSNVATTKLSIYDLNPNEDDDAIDATMTDV